MAKRVAVVPWLAQGHMIPLMQLSRKVANTVPVTMVSTPRNILRMKSFIGDTHTATRYPIEFAEIALPAVEGLPAGVENTADVQGPEQLMKLMNAFNLLNDPLIRLLRDLAPDCVLCDFGVSVTGADLGIPTVFFLSCSVSSFVANWYAAMDRTLPPLWDCLRGAFERSDGEREVRKGWVSTWAAATRCSAIVANTCDALEAPFMDYISHAESKPVLGLGPLLQEADAGGECGRLCLDWIERSRDPSAPASAVVYVAFGSECAVPEHDIGEIALGLKESGVAFLWALRRGRELLPRGFEESVRGRGLVVDEWVPQRRILKHRNVRAFVSHCGWSSVLEGLSAGVPLVAVPMRYEQGMNARLMAAYVKAAVEVERDSEGRLCAGDVAKAVKMVVSDGDGDGESVRKRARELSLVLQEEVVKDDGSQDAAVRRFVELIPSFSVKPLIDSDQMDG